jgi:putative phosphoesterase
VRVAALYDIHGNLPALEATLRDARAAGVDAVVVGGDVVPGPMPYETLACLTALEVPVHFIRGNGDRVVATFLEGGDITEVPEAFRDAIAWTADQLDASQRQLLATWAPTATFETSGVGSTFFCHATPRNDVECFTRATPAERVEPVFAGVGAAVAVCGHTHMQFDRMVARHRIVNAGSVGMPFSGPPGAYWLLFADGVHLRRTAYDVESAAKQFRKTGFPHVETMAIRYVVSPPTEAESLEVLAAAELRS